MNIHYIAQYANYEDCGKNYVFSPGGVSKMNYFLYVLSQLGINTQVFSLCKHAKKGISLHRQGKTPFGQPVKYACSLNINIRLSGLIANMFSQIQLFWYLLFVPNNDTVFFYHERFYAPIFKIIRKIKRYKIICDIEELYTVHAQYTPQVIEEEKEYLRSFDKYTIATSELIREIGLNKEDVVVCNGVYAPILPLKDRQKNNPYIQVLYAGTFDKTKGGVYSAISAFKYLDLNFRLVVCGWGNNAEESKVQTLIREINAEKKEEQIKYLGFVSGTSETYRDLLLSSDIGLSTQNPKGDYNTTSFPSKIFEYMRSGLIVVSTPLKVVESLPIAQCITTIQHYSPEGIAEAIKKAAKETTDSQHHHLQVMHNVFLEKFLNILS